MTKVKTYPSTLLKITSGRREAKRLTRLTGRDVAVRAYILEIYTSRLLELFDAPEAVKRDLSALLSDYAPRGAEVAEKVQRAFLDNPKYAENISQMAAAIGVHRTTIQNLMARGVVICPDERQWGGPWCVGDVVVRRVSRAGAEPGI